MYVHELKRKLQLQYQILIQTGVRLSITSLSGDKQYQRKTGLLFVLESPAHNRFEHLCVSVWCSASCFSICLTHSSLSSVKGLAHRSV